MNIIETGFNGLFIIEPTVFNDERGYFLKVTTRKNTKSLV
jgi:dTDP-4-dehydrorhamnose 3,5-epimerase-like enzyme